VFCQKYGDGDLYVAERRPTYFIVRGTPGLAFGWELKGPQKGYANIRFDCPDFDVKDSDIIDDGITDIDDPEFSHDYGEDAADYIKR